MLKPSIAPLLSLALFLGACDETDVVAVRVEIREDMSGTVRTSGLMLPTVDGPVQQATEGAVWGSRVELVCATGTFDDLAKLKIADITFGSGQGGEGIGFARVVIPRGPDVRWPRTFVPLTSEQRKEVAGAIDPDGKSESVGTTLKIELELPSAVIGNGLIGKLRGTKATADGSLATLVVPLDAMTTAGEPLTWHLTWQR